MIFQTICILNKQVNSSNHFYVKSISKKKIRGIKSETIFDFDVVEKKITEFLEHGTDTDSMVVTISTYHHFNCELDGD